MARVAFEVIVIHLLSSLITLSVCPQFGIQTWNFGHGLMAILMHFGTFGCYFFCGAFYLSTSVALMSLATTEGTWHKLKVHPWIAVGSVATISLTLFSMFSTQVQVSIGLAWLFGACASGLATLRTLSWPSRNSLPH